MGFWYAASYWSFTAQSILQKTSKEPLMDTVLFPREKKNDRLREKNSVYNFTHREVAN